MDITVIVPVKDGREHIGKTLDSIVKSGIAPKEVIIVDNESTDGTYQFCEQYIKDRPHMTLLRETFPGAAAARNKGLKSCKTDWVYFFDCGSLFDPHFISALQDVDATDYDMVMIPTKRLVGGKERVRHFIPSRDPRVQLLTDVLRTPNMLFRTSFLKDIGAWNAECHIGEDWELGLRAMLHQPRVMWSRETFHLIGVHAESDSCLSANYKQLVRTLSIVKNNLQSSILQPLSHYHAQHLACLYPHLNRLMYPLYLRTSILLGQLQREKMTGKCKKFKMAAKALTLFRKDNFDPTFSQRCTASCLRFYTLLGGKRAQEIALKIVKDNRKE